MKKILITGANSYIGMAFEKYMNLYENYKIDTIDMIGDNWKNEDFSDYDSVFHVAGLAHINLGANTDEMRKNFYNVNTDLAIETAKKAKAEGVKQFIFMSSASVYGDSAAIGKEKMITRDTPLAPSTFYGDSKAKAEKGIQELEDETFKVVILRPPMIYGAHCKGNYQLISKIAIKSPVFPQVVNKRSVLYIDNLSCFIKLMIDNDENGIFWPQNEEYMNTTELVKVISGLHNKKVFIIKGVSWALKIMAHMTGFVNKAFGNFCYEKSLSDYKKEYRVCNLYESIELTEKNNG